MGISSILILGSGTQALAIIRSVKRAGHRVHLWAEDKGNYAGWSRYVDKFYKPQTMEVDDGFLAELQDYIKENQIDALIPMGDTVAAFLSVHKDDLLPQVQYQAPCYSSFLAGYDKNMLMRLCRVKGYPHPETLDLSRFVAIDCDEVRSFPFPAMLKPNRTTGGRGMRKVESFDDLKACYEDLHKQYGDYHLQRFVLPGGRQIKVQLLVDREGNHLQHSVIEKLRWYPVQGGSCSCACSIENPEMVSICHSVLRDLNWNGFADFDLIQNPATGKFLIMEINPRVPACIKGAIAAGKDWGEILVNASLGLPQKTYTYNTGVTTRHLGFDTLWFLSSPYRFSKKQHWFRFFGKNVHYQDMGDWTDPLPFFAGTFRNIGKLLLGKK